MVNPHTPLHHYQPPSSERCPQRVGAVGEDLVPRIRGEMAEDEAHFPEHMHTIWWFIRNIQNTDTMLFWDTLFWMNRRMMAWSLCVCVCVYVCAFQTMDPWCSRGVDQ